MKLSDLVRAWKHIIRFAKKPDKSEFILSMKISLIAFSIVGGLAFIIHLVWSIFSW